MRFWLKIKKKYVIAHLALFLGAFLIIPSFTPIFGENILDLRQQMDVKKRDIESLDKEQDNLKKEIEQKQKESRTLANQLTILENSIKQAEIQIEKTKVEIEKTTLEINTLETQIQEIAGEIVEQKIVLAKTIRLLYQYDQTNLLEILFTYDSFAEFLDQVTNLEKLQNKGKETLDKIKQIKQELEIDQANLKKQKEALDELKKRLDEQKTQLNFEKEGKERLLRETEMKEEEYQKLLAQARAEQEAANAEIQQLEREIQKKLYEQQPDTWREIGGKTDLSWPIMPYEGISAYFMDPTYRAAFGIDHYAIDMPTPQGTPIHAPADGIVVKNRDAGYGYSYIMVYHGNDISTVYGHVSGFAAGEGQKVKKGDVIGYTGGTPGTRGAGWLTTGPHLHFEVRVNGTPVDPLLYLPKMSM
ncbi:MAG: peptidoglycan DD-metalloendopeptidase family protein [Patescibacteria group bacterium]